MVSACPEKDATEILSDSDHSTKVAPATLILYAVADACEPAGLICYQEVGTHSL